MEDMVMPDNRIKDEEQYQALRDKGMSKEKAARIANSPKKATGKKRWSGKKIRGMEQVGAL
jgi:hypothetical protein